ncbi:hypothetical protein D031_3546 [Vibrio parahaemolyticus VP-48]|nr:hypothetical protein D031_3546 [Vibrio parahaemolyticus VP-48]
MALLPTPRLMNTWKSRSAMIMTVSAEQMIKGHVIRPN